MRVLKLLFFNSTFVEFIFLFYVCRVKIKQMQLSKTEEQLMQYLWKRKKAFLKDLIEDFPEPKPATTTVATLLKRISDKGYIDFKLFGKSREYFPLVKKTDYFSKHVNGLIKNFFNDSASQFASFFTEETNLSTKELEDLKKIIDSQIKKQQK